VLVRVEVIGQLRKNYASSPKIGDVLPIDSTHQEILRKLSRITDLSPGVRVGQLLAHLGFLAEDMFDQGIAELEDDQLLRVLERHEGELSRRQSNVA
jgi:hypothetical protein